MEIGPCRLSLVGPCVCLCLFVCLCPCLCLWIESKHPAMQVDLGVRELGVLASRGTNAAESRSAQWMQDEPLCSYMLVKGVQ